MSPLALRTVRASAAWSIALSGADYVPALFGYFGSLHERRRHWGHNYVLSMISVCILEENALPERHFAEESKVHQS